MVLHAAFSAELLPGDGEEFLLRDGKQCCHDGAGLMPLGQAELLLRSDDACGPRPGDERTVAEISVTLHASPESTDWGLLLKAIRAGVPQDGGMLLVLPPSIASSLEKFVAAASDPLPHPLLTFDPVRGLRILKETRQWAPCKAAPPSVAVCCWEALGVRAAWQALRHADREGGLFNIGPSALVNNRTRFWQSAVQRRYSNIDAARDWGSLGLVVAHAPRAKELWLARTIGELRGVEVRPVWMREVTSVKLFNFAGQLDGFVLLDCPFATSTTLEGEDRRDFPRPVLCAHEWLLALGLESWEATIDFALPISETHLKRAQEEATFTLGETSLAVRSLEERLQTFGVSGYKGVPFGPEADEESTVLLPGRRGVANGYEDEPHL